MEIRIYLFKLESDKQTDRWTDDQTNRIHKHILTLIPSAKNSIYLHIIYKFSTNQVNLIS